VSVERRTSNAALTERGASWSSFHRRAASPEGADPSCSGSAARNRSVTAWPPSCACVRACARGINSQATPTEPGSVAWSTHDGWVDG
jgi:hypothetical protein